MNISVDQRFVTVLKKALDLEGAIINIDTDPKYLGLNSFSFIKLVVLVEEEFDIEFENEELDIARFDNLHSVLKCIEGKIAAMPNYNK